MLIAVVVTFHSCSVPYSEQVIPNNLFDSSQFRIVNTDDPEYGEVSDNVFSVFIKAKRVIQVHPPVKI